MPVLSIAISIMLGMILFASAQLVPFAQQAPESNIPSVSVPRLITLTGALRNRNAVPLSGVVGVRFAMYQDQYGEAPVWTEIQNVTADEQGRYSVLLGATQGAGLPMELFASSEPRWLGVQVQVAGEEEQQRVLLVSVPYALKAADADTIGGKPVSAFVLAEAVKDAKPSASASTASANITKDGATSFSISGTGTANMIAKWLDGAGTLADSAVFESGGSVGIGTTSPIGTLNVAKSGAANYLTLSSYQADVYDKGFLLRTARGTSGAPLPVQSGNALFNLYAQGHDGVDYGLAGAIAMAVDGSVSPGKVPGAILFQTSDSNGAFAERMRVNAAGNVGIGTPNPGAKLDVAGDLKVSGNILGTIPSLNLDAGGVLKINGNRFVHDYGSNNTFVGSNAGNLTMFGTDNTANGFQALSSNTTGFNNTAVGSLALRNNTIGAANTANGDGALRNNTSGNNNTGVGTSVLFNNTSGSDNTATGAGSLQSNTTGNFNTSSGTFALSSNTTGASNTASGYLALALNTTGFNNTANGANALVSNTTGTSNTALGVSALSSSTTASGNTAIGSSALFSNTSGTSNTATGSGALETNTTGNNNTAVGRDALNSNTGHENTAIGGFALSLNSTGAGNTAVGSGAGRTLTTANANTSGSNNTFIGYNSGSGTPTQLTNATAIGANALISASNALVLGDSSVSVGIGTQTPTAKLDVNGGVRLNTVTAKPTCDAASRGTFWFTQSAAGVKDTAEVCAKDAADVYAWRTLY